MIFYSIDQVCKMLGICRASFYKLLKRGEAPPIMKIGRKVLISEDSFNQWAREIELNSAFKIESK